MIDERGLAGGLLGAHVPHRADDVAGARQARIALKAGEAEVGDPQLAAAFDNKIRRLNVAMDDAIFVRRVNASAAWTPSSQHAVVML